MFNKIIKKSPEKIKRDSYFWNMVSSIAKAIQLTIFLAVISWVLTPGDAGIMSLAFSTAYLMRTIGDYAMRNFQVTDTRNVYAFEDYFTSRVVTMIFMVICSLAYVLPKGYGFEKTATMLTICFYMGIDAVEDVFHGMLQKKGRLDIAAFAASARYVSGIAVFAIALLATRRLWGAVVILFFFSALLCICLNFPFVRFYSKVSIADDKKKVRRLLAECFPLFLGAFLGAYINNAPKAAIDQVLNDELQGYFGMIFMPVFMINLFSTMVYRPITVRLAEEFNSKIDNYKRDIKKQYWYIAGITVICVAGAAALGIPLLSLFYNTSLERYKTSLIILMLGGGISAAISFSSVLLTIQRKQKEMLYIYGAAAVLSVLVSGFLVINWGILGASLLYILLHFLILVFMLIAIRHNIRTQNE